MQIAEPHLACLHGVGDPGLVGFSRSGGHKTKETYPTRPGSPTPCKQGLTQIFVCVSLSFLLICFITPYVNGPRFVNHLH